MCSVTPPKINRRTPCASARDAPPVIVALSWVLSASHCVSVIPGSAHGRTGQCLRTRDRNVAFGTPAHVRPLTAPPVVPVNPTPPTLTAVRASVAVCTIAQLVAVAPSLRRAAFSLVPAGSRRRSAQPNRESRRVALPRPMTPGSLCVGHEPSVHLTWHDDCFVPRRDPRWRHQP